jgi:hypothetical protein
MDQHQYEKYGPWQFNEVVGYIRLHLLGSQIRGEYFSAEKKRSYLGRKKVFTYRTHKLAPEVDIEGPGTNAQILAAIREYVADCKKELRRGRVIDATLLEAIGPHVDWRTLFGWGAHR